MASPTTAPTPRPDKNAYQVLGASITTIGVVLTVFGLNGMKYYQTKSGMPQPWKMQRPIFLKWAGTLCMWGMGQVVMMFAVSMLALCGIHLTHSVALLLQVNFATPDVCSATANIAIVVNAVVANKLFGETFNTFPKCRGNLFAWLLHWDLGSALYNIGGAVLVVSSAPALKDDAEPSDMKGVRQLLKGNKKFEATLVASGVFMIMCVLLVTAWRGKKSTVQGEILPKVLHNPSLV
jgi:hypothetical protein